MNTISVKRALLSVSDKTGLIEFAQALAALGVELISTGGTSQALKAANIPHRQVDDLTGLPEMLDGRVKTLHPKVHAGILAKRNKHVAEIAKHQIACIDLVVVNFYPFSAAVSKKQLSWDEAVEYIDIGGPTMVRAAAKNFAWVGVVVNPQDYALILQELVQQQGLSWPTRQQLAQKAFALTTQYDAAIQCYFSQQAPADFYASHLQLSFTKQGELRYGENPHQKACAYQAIHHPVGILTAQQHQGKPLSYNNILDSEAAWVCVREFNQPACVIVKHANPCAVAQADTLNVAYMHAYAADALSAFGGVVALNAMCTAIIAKAITDIFMEVVIAPSYSEEALAIFAAKPNLRLLAMPDMATQDWEMKFITGGLLLQEKDAQVLQREDLKVVTQSQPSPTDVDAMLFAWRVLKHVKSNGILLAKDNTTVGIGAGQVSRIDSVDIALRKAGDKVSGAILASDAFFPFRDSIDRIAVSGIHAIVQPGGSLRDQEVITACNEHGIAMAFTGKRCFRH